MHHFLKCYRYYKPTVVAAKMEKTLDLILFGATGLTGKYCISALYHLTALYKNGNQDLTWGIAGRSEKKLKETLKYYENKLGPSVCLQSIPCIIANLEDYESLKQMAGSCRVVINCCGPYRFYGESVIKACIEMGTHQIDVSGEPEFMEDIQLKYHDLAKQKGVYIVNSCGFDSIASDLAVLFLEKNFKGVLNSVETFLIDNSGPSKTNGKYNYATWESAIHGFANAHILKEIRSKQKRLPKFLPRIEKRSPLVKEQLIDGKYAVGYPSCDRSVVLRTRRHLFENKNIRPIQFENYMAVKSLNGLLLLALYSRIFEFLAQREYGRKLLLKFPDFFSNGYFTRVENLPEKKLESTKFVLKLLGTGWDLEAAKLPNDPLNYKDLPTKTIMGIVEGTNPAYGVASAAAVLSAIIVLLENDLLPSSGGVYTPGAAFIDTSLIEQLQRNNVLNFQIKSKL